MNILWLLAQTAQNEGSSLTPTFNPWSLLIQLGLGGLIATLVYVVEEKRLKDRDGVIADLRASFTTAIADERAASARDREQDARDKLALNARIVALEALNQKATDDRVRAAEDWAKENRDLALRVMPALDKAAAAVTAAVSQVVEGGRP